MNDTVTGKIPSTSFLNVNKFETLKMARYQSIKLCKVCNKLGHVNCDGRQSCKKCSSTKHNTEKCYLRTPTCSYCVVLFGKGPGKGNHYVG